jgi:hypothetical protein
MADTPTPPNGGGGPIPKIAGLSALKGLAVYAATLSFAGLYGYFIVRISTAAGPPPILDSVVLSAAAALAGVLGSAFALEVGVTTPRGATNSRLDRLVRAAKPNRRAHLRVQQLLSLEPINVNSSSWPKTIGIWVYAVVGAAVAVTYALNPHQTPPMIKALAVAFAGYILALLTAAYHDNGSQADPADGGGAPSHPEEEAVTLPPKTNGRASKSAAAKAVTGETHV